MLACVLRTSFGAGKSVNRNDQCGAFCDLRPAGWRLSGRLDRAFPLRPGGGDVALRLGIGPVDDLGTGGAQGLGVGGQFVVGGGVFRYWGVLLRTWPKTHD